MPKTKKKIETTEGSLTIGQIISEVVQISRQAGEHEPVEAIAQVFLSRHPEIADKKKCPNCGRSMKITGYEADIHNALLLLAMARKVREFMNIGLPFTEANRVHLPTLGVSDAVRKRETQCDYLRFIKQPDKLRGTGFWVITDLGWAALRGEAVPRIAFYWSGKLIRRSEEMIRIGEMFQVHRDQVAKAIALKKNLRSNHVSEIGDYDPKDWVRYGGTQAGGLFG